MSTKFIESVCVMPEDIKGEFNETMPNYLWNKSTKGLSDIKLTLIPSPLQYRKNPYKKTGKTPF